MCKWTDEFPEGSEHWLLGVVEVVDEGDHCPLLFRDIGWVPAGVLELLEPEAVMARLEEHLGVPKSTATGDTPFSALKVGDEVQVVPGLCEYADKLLDVAAGRPLTITEFGKGDDSMKLKLRPQGGDGLGLWVYDKAVVGVDFDA